MKKIRIILTLLTALCAARLSAQELFVDVDFRTYFDNKEFGSCTFTVPEPEKVSGTDFAARLTPRIGLRWEEKNSLVFGADMVQNFGEPGSQFLSEVKPVMYYQFQTPRVRAVAGIFTRDLTHDEDYSTAFFSLAERFVHNRMNGVLAQYNGRRGSYVEFVCDWEGMYSTASREKFRILSSGRHFLDHFYYGYNLTMLHFAFQKDAPLENVVDYLLVNPTVGVKFKAFFDFDIHLGLLQTAQRDRSFGHSWELPRMGEFGLRMSRWGFTLDERIYFGGNLCPFYGGHDYVTEGGETVYIPYGRALYPGESFFRTQRGFYNRASLSYAKHFFHDTVRVRAEFVTHCDGSGLGTQQLLDVAVKFLKPVYNSRNHKHGH